MKEELYSKIRKERCLSNDAQWTLILAIFMAKEVAFTIEGFESDGRNKTNH